MPQRLKRRSDAISHDATESESEETHAQRPHRRARSSSASSAASASSVSSALSQPTGQSQERVLIKKLVRLALATEYSRTPLRRSDITAKIFKENHGSGRSFKAVFEGAQRVLQDTFGMKLVELPSKEKTNIRDRRTQATQTKASSSSSKSWILLSILPAELKNSPIISQPTKAPNADTEASYTALYTFILSLIYLNNNSLPEQKLERYLKRVNADTYTPLGSLDKLLQRMMREGYVEKRRDTSSGEEIIEWTPGPRGKVEVGIRGVAGLVRSVYGHGSVKLSSGRGQGGVGGNDDDNDGEEGEARSRAPLVKMEEDELNARLTRSVGIRFGDATKDDPDADDAERDQTDLAAVLGDEGEEQEEDAAGPSRRRRQGQTRQPVPRRTGRHRRDEDDD